MSTETDNSWKQSSDNENDVRHVVPVADAMAHTLHADCTCKPEVELVEREDDSVGTVYIHNAWDGRP